MPDLMDLLRQRLAGQSPMAQATPDQGAPQMPQEQPQFGRGVPVGDTWRLPSGQYAPMNMWELMMRDFMAYAFGRGYAGQAGNTLEDERSRLKRELDNISR